jgi:penicillin-binding protein 2
VFGFFRKRNRNLLQEDIYPDEVFLDSSNLPQFDKDQFEGRIEKPISLFAIGVVGIIFLVVVFVFTGKLWALQIKDGEAFALRSENNRLRHTLVFAERGVVFDRRGTALVWNDINPETSEFSLRKYIEDPGFAHILGYVKYPSKDSSGFYYSTEFTGIEGIEKNFDHVLAGTNGLKIIETDALGKVTSESVIEPPQAGQDIVLSIDTRVEKRMHEEISNLAHSAGFEGGAGIIIDITDGTILAMTSYPEYSPNVMSQGKDQKAISEFLANKQNPFLNRLTSGVYTPGSIVKPYVALGALSEGVISPTKQILSTGSISVPNPYVPGVFSVFTDWKAHGLVDMRRALAVSSNVYFYEVGGGFEDQKGIGISNIEKYMRMFGFGSTTGIDIGTEAVGTIPNPEWKAKVFDGDEWRLGDTYNTSIGQYGFQVTPVQAVRAVSAIANGGHLVTPTLVPTGDESNEVITLPISEHPEWFTVVKEGMRQGVLEGSASGLNLPYVTVAAKTGTAELGSRKQFVNSWVTGFFPYENPRYAFALIMEKGPRTNLIGATSVMRQVLEWMSVYTPEYTR